MMGQRSGNQEQLFYAFNLNACRQTVDVGDDAAKFDSAIVEDLMKPVNFTGAHGNELTPVTGHQTRFAQILGRDEAAAHQTETRQHCQPRRVVHVRFFCPGHA